MNVKRFTAKTPREALALVRQAFGADAVVLSTRPSAEGVEVLAMAPESLAQIEQVRSSAPVATAAAAPAPVSDVQDDVEALSMSTLSFQDYVRERMLKRRQAAIAQPAHLAPPPARAAEPSVATAPAAPAMTPGANRDPLAPMLREEIRYESTPSLAQMHLQAQEPAHESADSQRREQRMLDELRQVKGLIEERFGALAFMEKMQRHPAQAQLIQKLLCFPAPHTGAESIKHDVPALLTRNMLDCHKSSSAGFQLHAGHSSTPNAPVLIG